MAYFVAPGYDICSAPFTEAVEDGAVLRMECIAHDAVAFRRLGGGPVVISWCCLAYILAGAIGKLLAMGRIGHTSYVFVLPVCGDMAVVVFKVVNAPFCKGGSVKILVPNTSWVASTSLSSGRAVETDLET